MRKKVNSFIVSNNNGDYEIQNIYSVIDDNGNYVHKNLVKDVFVADEKIIKFLNEIIEFLKAKIPDNE